jgi:aryl-alcohol dehydrogenase-like predicted oxidoreductase
MRHLKFKAADDAIDISAIACGTAEIGGKVGKHDSFAILDCFLEKGGTLIDTAKVYASWYVGDRPLSEEMIGQWMQLRRRCPKGPVLFPSEKFGAH